MRAAGALIAAISLAGAATAASATETQTPAFALPSFSTLDYDCAHWLRSVIVRRELSDKAGAYDVGLHDQGGAEVKGDIVQSVGHKPGSTIAFNGRITIVPCRPESAARPIVIDGSRLRFELTEAGELVYRDGSGTVTVDAKATKLPLLAKKAPPAGKAAKTPAKSTGPGKALP